MAKKQPAWVDSVYTEQAALYNNALDKFKKENNRQRGIVNADAGLAYQGVARNRTQGMTSLSEDFAARGMGRGGVFNSASRDAGAQYSRQKDNVTLGKTRGIQDLQAQRAKYEADNSQQVAAARREAYARLASRQKLV
jgi:hypothetical protein